MLNSYNNVDGDTQPKTITIAVGSSSTLAFVAKSSKSLPEEQRQAARRFLREVMARDFEGNQTKTGAALHVSQAMISDALSDNRGIGTKLLLALRAHTGASIEQILGVEKMPTATVRVPTDRYPARAEAIAAARRLGEATDDVLAEVAGDKLESENDPGLLYWMQEIDFRMKRRKLAESPKVPVRPKPAEPEPEGALDRRKRRKEA